MSLFEIVFSPTGGTEKVSCLVAGALDKNTVTVDLTDSGCYLRASVCRQSPCRGGRPTEHGSRQRSAGRSGVRLRKPRV